MEQMFEDIIRAEEEIIKVVKPNYKRFVWVNVMSVTIGVAIGLVAVFIYAVIMGYRIDSSLLLLLSYTLYPSLIILAFMGSSIYLSIVYKSTFYAYTNKRILIRTGFIGIDYRQMDYYGIGAINIRIGILDKILGRGKIGKIYFFSPSISFSKSKLPGHRYTFSGVEKPYEIHAQILNLIEKERSKLLQS